MSRSPIAFPAPAVNVGRLDVHHSRGDDDLRIEDLSLRERKAAGFVEAVRDHHARALEAARHPAGWILDGAGRRRRKPGPPLPARLGVTRRARGKVEQVRERSGMGIKARRKRTLWADHSVYQEQVPATDGI